MSHKKSSKNKKNEWKELNKILFTCLNFGYFGLNFFCSKQVLTCQNLESCILCNHSKKLGIVSLIRYNIPHPYETDSPGLLLRDSLKGCKNVYSTKKELDWKVSVFIESWLLLLVEQNNVGQQVWSEQN